MRVRHEGERCQCMGVPTDKLLVHPGMEKLVGKPNAVVPYVLFDERGWETKSWQVGLRRRIERYANSHRKPDMATIFDSTALPDQLSSNLFTDRQSSAHSFRKYNFAKFM